MRNLIFIVLFLLFHIAALAQINAGPDQIICVGETTTLQGTGPTNYTYEWSSLPNDPTISDPTSLTPSVTPSVSTIYTLEGRDVSFQNSVINGSFENGNTGFTSSYLFSPGPNGLWNEGTYAITDDASFNHNNFSCNQDHTSGSGNFMAVNGATGSNVVVWSQTINVNQNTEYEFSTWVMSLSSNNPAILQFRINGIHLGEPFQATSVECQWKMFFEEWNSGIATTAEISIINQNENGDGNDFSLDDINFSKVTYFYDDCNVTVNSIPTSDFDIPAQSCSSDTVVVNYTGNASATAIYNWDFGIATVISGSGPGPYELLWTDDGLQTVSLYVDDACISGTTSKNINILQSPLVNVSAIPTSILWGTTSNLHGSMTGNSGELVFEWDPSDSIQNPSQMHPETKPLRQTTLFTFTSNNLTNMCSASDTVTVHVTGGPLAILSVSASPDTICLGDSTNLSISITGGSGSYTSTWRSEPSGFDLTTTETTIKVSPTETTTYFVNTFDGFSTTPEYPIEVVILPLIEIVDQPVDILISFGQNAVFDIESINETSYQWQVSEDGGTTWADITDNTTYNGSTTPQLTIVSPTPVMSSFLYRCLLAGACDPVYSVDAELTVIDNTLFIGILDDTVACQNDTIYVPCKLSNFNNIDSFNLDFTYDTAFLEFLDLENIHSELSSIQTTNFADSINLSWYSGNGVTIGTGIFFNFKFIAKTGGEDSLLWSPASTVRNSYGFFPEIEIFSANINITALPIAPDSVIAFPDSLNILDEVDIELIALGGLGYEILWTQDTCGGDSVASGDTVNILRPEQTTIYYAQWKNYCGISECKGVEVKIIEQYSFFVPNAFTPNGDALNDEFGILSPSALKVFDFYVFNRWGQVVFSTKDQNEKWDGTYNGEISQQGSYIWKTRYQYRLSGIGSEVHEESGTVTLIR